ncbi:MAG: hypothetical protein AB7I27_09165 [Bacteriovoracaceae bacterium]
MNMKKTARILPLVLSFQLIVGPVLAADTKPADKSAEKKSDSDFSQKFAAGLGLVGAALTKKMSANQMPQQMADDMAYLTQQQMPLADKYFSAQSLSKLPGLLDYLRLNNINPAQLECKTLATNLHEVKAEVCRLGVMTDKGVDPQYQLEQIYTYYNQFQQIEKLYKNYNSESNVVGQGFGIGCMKNAMKILNGFFQYRLNELDKLVTQIEAINNNFKEKSKSDLNAIEEATAVLEGDSDLADKVKSRRPDLFDYAKRFNDPACMSMDLNGGNYNELGKAGLNGIKAQLKDMLNEKQGNYSGASFSQGYPNIVTEIQKMADRMAKQVEMNFSSLKGDYLGQMKSFQTGTDNKYDISSKLVDDQAAFLEQNKKFEATINDVGGTSNQFSTVLSKITDLNSPSFETDLKNAEMAIQNECLAKSFSSTELIKKIYDPSASKYANTNSSKTPQRKIADTLSNPRTTLDQKLEALKLFEKESGNRYILKQEGSYEVQTVNEKGEIVSKLKAGSQDKAPSVFFADVVQNCKAQFKVNKLGNRMTAEQAIQKIKMARADYVNFAKSHAQTIKQDVVKKLIECDGNANSAGKIQASCSPSSFKTDSAGFCANAALTCASNMQQCSQKAEKYASEIKTERTARVNNYKALVEKNKQDIVKIFDTALSKYLQDGEIIRGAFGTGFESPEGIKRDVDESEKYLESFKSATGKSPDGKLLLEDPAKYVEMLKENVNKLKASVAKQQQQILGEGGEGGLLGQQVALAENNLSKVEGAANKLGNECLEKYDTWVKNSQKQRDQMAQQQFTKQNELGERKNDFCYRYSLAQENPNDACDGQLSDLIKTASIASATNDDDKKKVKNFISFCRRSGSHNDTYKDLTWSDACLDSNGVLSKLNGKSSAKKSDGTSADELTKLCNELKTSIDNKECKKPVTTSDNKSVIVDYCEDKKESIVSQYKILLKNRGEEAVTLDEAPAFCTAGNNSDRNANDSKSGSGNTGLDIIKKAIGM